MDIAIHSTEVFLEKKTGIGIYTTNLIKNLSKLDKKNRYFLLYKFTKVDPAKYPEFKITNPNFQYIPFEPKISFLIFKKFDIFHDPAGKFINIKAKHNIVTMHDIAPIYENFSSAKFKAHSIRSFKKAVEKSTHIIAVSEFTKKEIIKYFNINELKITVIHEGVNLMPQPKIKTVQQKSPYILYVGTIEQRKNLINLVTAFNIAKKHLDGVKLIIAGKDGHNSDFIKDYIEKNNSDRRIELIGYIEPDKVSELYANAIFFIYISFYEGFGLPVLEAISHGIPVIASAVPSVIETVGKRGCILVPADSPEIIAKNMILLYKNKKLRAHLVKESKKIIRNFTWEKTALKTLQLYESLA